jgi:hypothetical protein
MITICTICCNTKEISTLSHTHVSYDSHNKQLNTFNRCLFLLEMDCVLYEVGTKVLCVVKTDVSPQRVNLRNK